MKEPLGFSMNIRDIKIFKTFISYYFRLKTLEEIIKNTTVFNVFKLIWNYFFKAN